MDTNQHSNSFVTLRNDLAFKSVFGNEANREIIIRFISDLLEIPRNSIRSMQLAPTVLTTEYRDEKYGILDLLFDIDGQTINIEVQLSKHSQFNERTLFYWAKLYYGKVDTGKSFGEARKTICINIVDFDAFEFEDYHSCFEVRERENGTLLSDKLQIHFFELKKLEEYRKNKPVEEWLDLLNANTEEELMNVKNNANIPEVKDTAVKITHFNADEMTRHIMLQKEIWELDQKSFIEDARNDGLAKGLAQGETIGFNNALVSLVKNGTITLSVAAENAKMTEEEFRKFL